MYVTYKEPTVDDIEMFAAQNDVTICLWEVPRERCLPKLLVQTSYEGETTVNIKTRDCNEPNDFSLEGLELILNKDEFLTAIKLNESRNFWQCAAAAGMIECESWLDLISEWGDEVIRFGDERKLRRNLGFGFELYTGRVFIDKYYQPAEPIIILLFRIVSFK